MGSGRTFVSASIVCAAGLALVLACSSEDGAGVVPPGEDGGGAPPADDGGGGDASSSSSSSGGGDSGPTITADCAAFADAYCELIATCAPFLITVGQPDLAACKARTALGCSLSKKAQGVTVDLTGCAAALGPAGCAALDSTPAACRATGTLANDAPCEHDMQCQSGACTKAAAATCGTCQPRAAASASCAAAKCDWGTKCVNGTCIAPRAKNAACVKGACAIGLACVGGVCVDPLPANAPCTRPLPTADDPCEGSKGYACGGGTLPDAGPPTCAPLTLGDPGDGCGFVGNKLVVCKGGTSCEGTPGLCILQAADGTPCNDATGPSCAGPAECLNGTCTIPDPGRCK